MENPTKILNAKEELLEKTEEVVKKTKKKTQLSVYYDDTLNKRVRAYRRWLYQQKKQENVKAKMPDIDDELAEEWKMSASKVRRIDSGFATAHGEQLNLIAQTLDCPVDDLTDNYSEMQVDFFKRIGIRPKTASILKRNVGASLLDDKLKYATPYGIVLNEIICQEKFLNDFQNETQNVVFELKKALSCQDYKDMDYNALCKVIYANDSKNTIENMEINLQKSLKKLIEDYMNSRLEDFRNQ